ncbi:MAG: metallophosphoesterase family protein [Verrucomicrobiota bacterium]
MTLLVIADDEFVLGRIPDCPADVLICCGDLTDDIIIQVAAKCGCREIFAVKGNHDSTAPFRSPIRDLHLVTLPFRGVTFGGFCGGWKFKPKGNFLFEQSEVARHLESFPGVNVFVAHNSPRHVHDREDDVHIGFVAFNSYITRTRPRLFLHGHQHENMETRIGGTRVIGTFGHRYLVLPE